MRGDLGNAEIDEMAVVFLSRLGALSGVLLTAACVSTSEPSAGADDVPLPRPRPSALYDVPMPRARSVAFHEAPQDIPQRIRLEAVARENSSKGSEELLKEWALCKLLFVEGSARRTNRPVEELLHETFTACSEREDELKVSLAQRQIPETVIAETVANIRALDRDQLAKRIVAARRSH
jgi:hypothetical protein